MRLAVRRFVTCHLCDSPGLQSELRHLGLCASVVRLLPARIEAKVEPLPVLPAVLSYWHSLHRAFYNASMVFEIARRFSGVPFMIVGDNGDGIADVPENIRFLGPRTDMDNVYSQITVYLRFPEHDSLSAMVLEVLARGRYVIYNQDHQVSGVSLAHDVDSACRLLKDLLDKCEPNYTGAEFVRRNYSLAEQSRSLLDVYIKSGMLPA